HQDTGDLFVVEHQVVGPAEIARNSAGLRDGFDRRKAKGHGEERRGLHHNAAVDSSRRFGVPGVSVTALPGGLFPGENYGAERQSGGGAHGGVDGRIVVDAALRKSAAQPVDVHHTSSRRKLMSMARAEWVIAPEETKSAPASA